MEAIFFLFKIETSTIFEKLVVVELGHAPTFSSYQPIEVFSRSHVGALYLGPKPS